MIKEQEGDCGREDVKDDRVGSIALVGSKADRGW